MQKEILFQLPGQGCHFIGMGADLFQSGDAFFKRLIEIGSETAHEDIALLMQKGSQELLNRATVVQPAISAITLTLVKRLKEQGVIPSHVMGHSLGEITALGVTGVISPEETVEMATIRGILMDMSAKSCGESGMSAVLLAGIDQCQTVIQENNLSESLFVANDNAPTQAVISGLVESLDLFSRKISDSFRARVQRIAVTGPWHTPFIEPGRKEFEHWVRNKPFAAPQCTYIMNGTAAAVSDPEEIRQLITGQLVKPVRWQESLEYVKSHAIQTIIEVGPGKILSGLLRANKMNKTTKFHQAVTSIDETFTVSKELLSSFEL